MLFTLFQAAHLADTLIEAEGAPAPAPRASSVGPNRYAALKAEGPTPFRSNHAYGYGRRFPHLSAA